MFQKSIISKELSIDKFFNQLNFDLYLTKPSSKAINVIEKCSFHNSHLKGKTVYGHQILVSLLSCDGLVLPYSKYNKKTKFRWDI